MEKMNVRKRLNHPSIQIFALQISLIIPEYHLPNRYLVLPSYTPLIPNPITYSHLSGYRSIELTNERKVNRMRKKKREERKKREKVEKSRRNGGMDNNYSEERDFRRKGEECMDHRISDPGRRHPRISGSLHGHDGY